MIKKREIPPGEELAVPIDALPEEMTEALKQLVAVLLYKYVPDHVFETSSFDLNDTLEEIDARNMLPVVIASGTDKTQRLTFKLLDPSKDGKVKVAAPRNYIEDLLGKEH